MDTIKSSYEAQVRSHGDISDHLPTFRHFATLGDHITELGTRTFVSGWGWLMGMLGSSGKKLVCVDLYDHPNISIAKKVAAEAGLSFDFVQGDDVKITPWETDILFIDSFHVYPHLKAELKVWAPATRKYILMHDTEIDAIYGEAIRDRLNLQKISAETGYKVEDLSRGLRPAIEEFLADCRGEWELHTHYVNNNGLTVLKRIN
jgi:cephalosporin hydroxylase